MGKYIMELNKNIFKYAVYYPVTLFNGINILKYIDKLNGSQKCSGEELKKIQLTKLNMLIKHSQIYVPYYNECTQVNTIEDIYDLKKLPLINKKEIRENISKFRTSQCCKRLISKTTGGSTGAPVTVLKTNVAMAQELAATWRGYGWAGIDIGDKQARFWGVPHDRVSKIKAQLIDFMCNRYRFSAFNFTGIDLLRYHKILQKYKPKYFYGYVSMIIQYAEFLIKNRLNTPSLLSCIITTSEVLTYKDRTLLQEVFKCPVYNEYGCGEIGTIAHECECGSLHVNDENIILEILDENQNPVKKGEYGEIVVTELNNYAMPLIRYRIGDYGCIGVEPCKCGRKLTLLKEIKGREYDFLINKEGKKFHGEFFLYIIEDIKKEDGVINGVQFVQKKIEKLEINIVSGKGFKKTHKKKIVDRLREGFDPNIVIEFHEKDSIKREESGKLRVVKRLIQ